MHRKHSLDFRFFTNVAQYGSIFIFVRQTRGLFRKLRRSAGSIYDCTSAALLRILPPILVAVGILAITAIVVSVVYERVSVFSLGY